MSMKETMTLEQVRDVLRLHAEGDRGQWETMDRDDLAEYADAIDAHLASQPAEQPRGENVELGYVPGELDRTAPEVIYLQVDTAGDNDERDEPWTGDMDENVSWFAESIGGLEIQYVRGDLIDQPKPERPSGDEEGDGNSQKICRGCGNSWPEYLLRDELCLKCRKAKIEQAVGDGVEGWIVESEKAGFVSIHRYDFEADKVIADVTKEYGDAYGATTKRPVVAPSPAVATPAEVTDAQIREWCERHYLFNLGSNLTDARAAFEDAQSLASPSAGAVVPEGIISEVRAERSRQDAKWGEQNHPHYTPYGSRCIGQLIDPAGLVKAVVDGKARDGELSYSDILIEEVAEAVDEARAGNVSSLRTELVQVAAVAVAWVESIDRRAMLAAAPEVPGHE